VRCSTLAVLALWALPSAALSLPVVSVEPALQRVASGDPVAITIRIDTDGLTFEGYAMSLQFSGTAVASLATRQALPLPGLTPDFFGAPDIDEPGREIRNLNQASIFTRLPPGSYAMEEIEFVLSGPIGSSLTITPFLDALEAFGLDGTGCPNASPPCSLDFVAARVTIAAEPGWMLLWSGVALGSALLRRRLTRPA